MMRKHEYIDDLKAVLREARPLGCYMHAVRVIMDWLVENKALVSMNDEDLFKEGMIHGE